LQAHVKAQCKSALGASTRSGGVWATHNDPLADLTARGPTCPAEPRTNRAIESSNFWRDVYIDWHLRHPFREYFRLYAVRR
jgi:hypothetical protein